VTTGPGDDAAQRAAAAGGTQLLFSDSDEEEETLNENDAATQSIISKFIALQTDAQIEEARARLESEHMIEETHYVWMPPFAQGCLWVALPKSGQGKDFFRVGYNFDFLLVRTSMFKRKIQSLPHMLRRSYAGAGKGGGVRKRLWVPRSVMAQLILEYDGPFGLRGRQYGRHFVDNLNRYQAFRRLVLSGYDFGELDFTVESEFAITENLLRMSGLQVTRQSDASDAQRSDDLPRDPILVTRQSDASDAHARCAWHGRDEAGIPISNDCGSSTG